MSSGERRGTNSGDRHPSRQAGEHELQGVALPRARRAGDQEPVAGDVRLEALELEAVAADADGHEAAARCWPAPARARRARPPRRAGRRCAAGGATAGGRRTGRSPRARSPAARAPGRCRRRWRRAGPTAPRAGARRRGTRGPGASRCGTSRTGMPMLLKSPGSLSDRAIRSSISVLIRPTSPLRSAVITIRMPTPAPSCSSAVTRSSRTPPSSGLVGLDEALPAVEEYDEVGQSLLGRDAGPLLADVGEPALGERLLPLGQLLLQEGDQAVHPVGLRAGDHGADVRQRDQGQQRVVAGVDAVEVHVLGRAQPRDPAGEHAQAVAAPGAGLPGDHQVRAGDQVPALVDLQLLAGEVGAAEGDGRVRRRVLERRRRSARSSSGSTSGSGGSHGLRISGSPSSSLASLIAATREARSVGMLTSSSSSSTGPVDRPSNGRSPSPSRRARAGHRPHRPVDHRRASSGRGSARSARAGRRRDPGRPSRSARPPRTRSRRRSRRRR